MPSQGQGGQGLSVLAGVFLVVCVGRIVWMCVDGICRLGGE